MQYTETELTKLIENVEKEFSAHLAKAETDALLPTLSKAEDTKPKPKEKEESKPESKGPPQAEAKPEAAPEGQAPPAPEGEAPPAAAPAQAAPAQAAPGQAQPAGHDYDEQDMASMKQMYMSMSESELKAHHDAIAEIMKSKMGGMGMGKSEGKSEIEDENPTLNSKATDKGNDMFPDKQNGGIEGSKPHNSLGPKSPASKADGVQMGKSEHDRRNGGKIEGSGVKGSPGAKSPASTEQGNLSDMEKSENTELELLKSELTASNAKFEELKKNFDAVALFLTELVKHKAPPAGKAITSYEVVTKNEDLGDKTFTKDEIHQTLLKKSCEPTLQKSDREAINFYYANGQVDVKGISHLLK